MGGNFEQDMAQCNLAAKFSISLLRINPQPVPTGDQGPDYGDAEAQASHSFEEFEGTDDEWC
jgi:hypothetical protein